MDDARRFAPEPDPDPNPGPPSLQAPAPGPRDPTAGGQALGRLVQVREVAHRGPQFGRGCLASIVCLVLIPILMSIVLNVDHGAVDAAGRPILLGLIVGIIWGFVTALKGLAAAKERFHFHEGGLVYIRGRHTETIPWQSMQAMYPLGDAAGPGEEPASKGYRLEAAPAIGIDLPHPPTGPDPFVEWAASVMRHHGRLNE